MAEDRGGDDADKTNTAQEHHHDLYHYVFIIVGSIVTAGIEFALVWPENHHFALLLIQRDYLPIRIVQEATTRDDTGSHCLRSATASATASRAYR